MNEHSEPSDDMLIITCLECKGIWWVPYYEEIPELSIPGYCTYCGLQIDYAVEDEEN